MSVSKNSTRNRSSLSSAIQPRRTFFALALTCAVTACSNAPQVTHHWVAQETVAGGAYQRDLAACSDSASTGKPVNANSEEFRTYKNCMAQRGYTLASTSEVSELVIQGNDD